MLTRRELLVAGAAMSLPVQFLDAVDAAGIRVREDIADFSKDPAKVNALRDAVAAMKARSSKQQHDPKGWYYWYAVHWSMDPPPTDLRAIYRQCDHTQDPYVAQHFLSWHRAFLFYFEVALKAGAKEAGAIDIELPYWNWYDDGKIPDIFVTGNEASNPLWHKRRRIAVNPAALERSFFDNKQLLPTSNSAWADSFSVPLEYNPHGSVHGTIGYDMGDPRTSARDPIFWLHHCNIDRLWSAWIKRDAGNTNPPDGSVWRTRQFTFDKQAVMKTSAGDVLDEQALGYRYDNYVPFPEPAVADASSSPTRKVEAGPASSGGGTLRIGVRTFSNTQAVSRTGALTLGGQSVTVDMKVAAPARSQLRTLATGETPPAGAITGAWLVLERVEIAPDGRDGGFSFSIVARLPKGKNKVSLGELNTFNWPARVGDHDHGAREPITLSFPLSAVLKKLGASDLDALGDGLRVDFIATHLEVEDKSYVKIESMSIKTTNLPLQ